MMRIHLLVVTGLFALLALPVGCGDNSKLCGPGTNDEDDDGECEPDGGASGVVCGDGTRLDPITMDRCIADPSACGPGLVLVNGTCQDPTAGLAIDLEEGPEPNGLEDDATPAGDITLEPVGSDGFVIHGCIKPLDNETADLDAYLLTVTEPTLVKVTADGVGGLAAGFLALSASTVSPLADYARLGLNVATDMSRRQLYLPAAGTYVLFLSDTRTLLPLVDGSGGAVFPPAGNPDGTSCYYVTLDRQTPMPVALDLTTGDTGTIGEDIKFYTATGLAEGLTQITETINSPHAAPSLVITNAGQLRQINDDGTAFFGGIKSTDTPLIVGDFVFNYDLFPTPYRLRVDFSLASQALCPASGACTANVVNATSKGEHFFVGGQPTLGNLNLFHWDVLAPTTLNGLDLAVSQEVAGFALDANGDVVANFGGLTTQRTIQDDFGDPLVVPSMRTFTTYRGLLRTLAPGRYYFALIAPRDPVATAFTVTTTIAAVIPSTLTFGAELANQTLNEFRSSPFTYNATTEPWQQLDATGTNMGANIVLSLLHPTTTFGRLDAVTFQRTEGTSSGGVTNTTVTDPHDVAATPIVRVTVPATGAAPVGRILATSPTTNYLVKVNGSAPTGTATFSLDFERREHHDFGMLAATGTPQTVNNEPLDATHVLRRFFFRTDFENIVTISVTPDTVLMDPVLRLLRIDETTRRTVNTGAVGATETVTFLQGGERFTAFTVASNVLLDPQSFTLAVTVAAPFYDIVNTTTAYADACVGGTVRPFAIGNDDDGVTAAIAPPAGFTFFGATTSDFVVSSNGFLTFDATSTDAAPFPVVFPDGVGTVNIAPFWGDLDAVDVCTKTVGGKLVIQWTGVEFAFFGGGATVQLQAILDPTDDSIEYVWGPLHAATGESAVSGVQNPAGDRSRTIGAFTSYAAPATSKKLVP